jgi:hypothetical protein
VDVAYQYLTFFLHDEAKLEEIRREYGAGRMKTYDVKQMLVEVLQEIVREHQVSLKQACRDLALEEGKKKSSPACPFAFLTLLPLNSFNRRLVQRSPRKRSTTL